jgi:hypothetical protein
MLQESHVQILVEQRTRAERRTNKTVRPTAGNVMTLLQGLLRTPNNFAYR